MPNSITIMTNWSAEIENLHLYASSKYKVNWRSMYNTEAVHKVKRKCFSLIVFIMSKWMVPYSIVEYLNTSKQRIYPCILEARHLYNTDKKFKRLVDNYKPVNKTL